jgi:CelD/BcsL family acetyltransferase involved in cellulose biosynthesis
MERSPPLAELGSRLARSARYSPEADFALGDPRNSASAATVFMLPRVADAQAAARRRSNYGFLLDELGDLVPPPFAELPDGASPFAFPIATDDKEALLARLASHGVHATNFWSAPHPALPPDRFPGAASLRSRLVGVPVHQELRAGDLDRIAHGVRERRARTATVRLEPLESFADVQEEWSELARQSGNIFATWEWATIWWRHFGEGRPLLARACRSEDGRLVAILPLYLWSSRPVRVVRFLGHGPADHLGPICDPADLSAAARALRRTLAELDTWDVFVGEGLAGDKHWSELVGGRVLGRDGNPVLRAGEGGWDAYLSSRSANLRQQVRRRERNLERAHSLSYRLADDPARLPDDLDTLFGLHAARWDAGATPFAGADEAFHREFAECALERGWLRFWFLELDGEPCAALYGFRFCGFESFYQSGRDPAWDDSSLGFVLLAHAIRAALDDGVRECRFLRGDHPYKYRFADTDPGVETIGVARGAAGGAALMALATLGKRGPVAALRRRVVG